MSDPIGRAFRCLGATGLILLASGVVFAFLGTGVVVHRLEEARLVSSSQSQRGESDRQDSKRVHSSKSNKGPKPGHPRAKESPEQND